MPPFYGLWVWFRNNPLAQGIAAAVAGVVLFFGWLGLHDRKVRREASLKSEIKARKTADKIISRMEKESNERIEKANQAADAVVGDVTSDSLRDDTRRILFGD
jgi:hypothetical protein